MIDATKVKLRAISKELWQGEDYRSKVISGVSKPRRKGFKSEQSKRITQWYRDNPEQKTLRSDHMSKSWKQGRIEPNINSINESKLERSLRAMLEAALPELMIQKKTIRVAGKWFYPDVMIEDKYVVEFYGTLWHADPYYYKPDDVIHHRFTATQIWTRDKEREKTLQEAGYNVIVVWQREFVGNEQSVVDRVKSLIENDKGV
jgi:G:T-mismatch repair DNA endonuclease (very short patch repair protein)